MPELEILTAIAHNLGPGALPAGAIIWVWAKLDKRISILEERWEILWSHHTKGKADE